MNLNSEQQPLSCSHSLPRGGDFREAPIPSLKAHLDQDEKEHPSCPKVRDQSQEDRRSLGSKDKASENESFCRQRQVEVFFSIREAYITLRMPKSTSQGWNGAHWFGSEFADLSLIDGHPQTVSPLSDYPSQPPTSYCGSNNTTPPSLRSNLPIGETELQNSSERGGRYENWDLGFYID